MSKNDLMWEKYCGNDIDKFLLEVAQFRIKYFRDYPYFYDGNLEYELNYLDGYVKDEKSILIIIRNLQKEIVAVSTGVPLITSSDILTDAEAIFLKNSLNPSKFYYYGEVILDYSIRSQGLTRLIYNEQDKHALSCGFKSVAIATVVREFEDPRNITHIPSSDAVWGKLGFKATNIDFNYHWPTIQPDGSTIDCENKMIFWIKNLKETL